MERVTSVPVIAAIGLAARHAQYHMLGASNAMRLIYSTIKKVAPTENETTWSTPYCLATATVPSVQPSSMISHSTSSTPGTALGKADKVTPIVSASL